MPTPGHPAHGRPPSGQLPNDPAGPTTALDAPTVRHGALPTSPPPSPAKGSGLSTVRVTGQALAATTTAAAGGFLGGAAGTVVGAGVASIVTTVGEALYQRSLERTRDRVRTRIDARRTRPAGQPPPDEAPTRVLGAASPATSSWSRARIAVLVATTIVIFLIAMVVVTGIERVKGSPLSGGPAGTSVGEVFGTAAPTTTTTAPDEDDDEGSGASATATTTAPEPTTSAAPTTTSRSRTTTPTTTLVPSGN